jgi:hypothetical protein
MAFNEFSDWTAAEFKKLLGYKPSHIIPKNYTALPPKGGDPQCPRSGDSDCDWR